MDNEKSLFERLKENKKIPFHMPGHKRKNASIPNLNLLGSAFDITEIEGFDNLHNPNGIIKNSMSLAAKVWGAKKSFYLVNGSSGGILAAVFSCINFGDTVICARNLHKSVYNALRLIGANVKFVNPAYDKKTGICGEISSETVENACKAHPEAKLVIITSPTYEGVISNIEKISKTAHQFNMTLLVDEAHGAHLSFASFCKGAVKSGADIVVQSLHKTLSSLTQTAIVHVCTDRININKLKENLSVFQTTSPSYLFLASQDLLVRTLCEKKDGFFKAWEEGLNYFYSSVKDLENLEIMSAKTLPCFAFDKSKIVILTHKTNITGKNLADILRNEYNIECEMASARYAVAMTGSGDDKESLKLLSDALVKIDKTLKRQDNPELFLYPEKFECEMTPFDAQKHSFCKAKYKEAENKISAEYVFAYPPGIPILIPGEKITPEILKIMSAYAKNGISLTGSLSPGGENIHIIY